MSVSMVVLTALRMMVKVSRWLLIADGVPLMGDVMCCVRLGMKRIVSVSLVERLEILASSCACCRLRLVSVVAKCLACVAQPATVMESRKKKM